MVGWLVHNQVVIKRLQEAQIIILDDSQLDRYQLVDNLQEANDGDAIIFSAHGTRQDAIILASQKGYQVYDLTCPYVYKTHKLIKNKLSKGYEVYFIGKNNHPETNAILAIDANIKLVDVNKENNINKMRQKDVFVTNQTTLSVSETEALYNSLKNLYPSIDMVNDICDATTKRQEAIKLMPHEVEGCFIIGDVKSSNANELYHLAQTKVDSYLITGLSDIKEHMWKDKKCVAVIGAASCPSDLIDEVYDFLISQ